MAEKLENDERDRFLPLAKLATQAGCSVEDIIERIKSTSSLRGMTMKEVAAEEPVVLAKKSSLSSRQRREVVELMNFMRGVSEAVERVKAEEPAKTEEQTAAGDGGVANIKPNKEASNG